MKKRLISVIIGCLIVAVIAVMGNICRVRTVTVKFDSQPINVTSEEIFSASGIDMRRSILSINENTVKINVNKAFDDNSVYVRNVERKFPDEVVLYAEERAPLCAVKLNDPEKFGYEEGDGYGITDIDFQMNMVGSNAEAFGRELIFIEGVTVSDTYNTVSFEYLHKIFKAFEGLGMDANAQKKFIGSIVMSSGGAELRLRDGGIIVLTSSKDNLDGEVKTAYEAYLSRFNG